jgi:ATP-dependent DNA ligase
LTKLGKNGKDTTVENLEISELPQKGFMLIGADGSDHPEEWLSRYKEYYLEPKVDDVRMMMHFLGGRVRFQSRGKSVKTGSLGEKTANYPQFTNLYDDSLEGTVLDGGMVSYKGKPHKDIWKDNDLFKMISINGSIPERAIRFQEENGWAKFIVFDIVRFNGQWLNEWPIERRRVLAEVIAADLGLSITPQQKFQFQKCFDWIVREGGEGVVLKKHESPYQFDRSKLWVRVKKFDDAVVWFGSQVTPGEGRLKGVIGSVNVYDEHGICLGAVSGFSDDERVQMTLKMNDSTIRLKPDYIGRQVLIRHNGATGRGGFRHARIIKWAEIGQDLRIER